MIDISVSIDTMYQKEYKYIVGILETLHDTTYAEYENANRRYINILTNENNLISIQSGVQEIILVAFKYNYFLARLGSYTKSVLDQAIIFVAMDFDSESERKSSYDIINSYREYHIDSDYRFLMRDMIKGWNWITNLLQEFFDGGPSDKDKKDLLAFMMSMNLKTPVKKNAKYFVSQDKNIEILQRVFYYQEHWQDEDCMNNDTKKLLEEFFE